MSNHQAQAITRWELELAQDRADGISAAARSIVQAELTALDECERPGQPESQRTRRAAKYQALRAARMQVEADAAFAERELAELREAFDQIEVNS